MLFNILALISFFIILLLLKTLVGVFPSLLACLIRWKESVNLDASVQLGRDRDIMALTMVLPFCLTVCRFNLYAPQWMESMGEAGRLGIITGIFIAFILLRKFMEHIWQPKKMNPKTYRTACKSAHTFFSILALLLLITGGVMSFLDAPGETIKTAMLWISATIYLLFILRKSQIFISSCSFFTTFLYLCALEIIPTGALVASAIIF